VSLSALHDKTGVDSDSTLTDESSSDKGWDWDRGLLKQLCLELEFTSIA